jgi:hypothetical protein
LIGEDGWLIRRNDEFASEGENNIRTFLHHRDSSLKAVGREKVVGAEQDEIVGRGPVDAFVEGRMETEIGGVGDHGNSLVGRGELPCHVQAAICGCVVDDENPYIIDPWLRTLATQPGR